MIGKDGHGSLPAEILVDFFFARSVFLQLAVTVALHDVLV